ncbi:MAG TPA: hypothetical protein VFH10_00485 [Nocardioides sp.]|uniref:hypothetical protein n=1 Tax=Nocardioides sp. TaxID=35761 RepID=UPI002D7E9332|nr:hypothetical protein [Nocardioides sp.]HET6651087.1 hypothetical protein [Nocardioides sp.]
MTLIHPGSAGTVSPSPQRGAVDRGYPASLSAMVAQQRTADLIRTTEFARIARQGREASPRWATPAVSARGVVGAVRVALAQALTRHAPHAMRRGSKGRAALTGSTSQLVCCAA